MDLNLENKDTSPKTDALLIMKRIAQYNKNSGQSQIYFDEYFAKNILQHFLKLEGIIIKDRPDLRCDTDGRTIGIEVVNGMTSDYHELWKHVYFEDDILYVDSKLNPHMESIVDKYFPRDRVQPNVRDVNLNFLEPRHIGQIAVDDIKSAFENKKRNCIYMIRLMKTGYLYFVNPMLCLQSKC